MKRTDSQLLASDPARHIWVSASAGTGKTHVLTDRLLRLMPDGAAPDRILALTFTKAAAAEMATRLLNRVVAPEALMPVALDIAGRIAARSALTVRMGKRGFYRQIDLPLQEAYREAACVMADNLMARDAAEGIGAFLEKRRPVWEDR